MKKAIEFLKWVTKNYIDYKGKYCKAYWFGQIDESTPFFTEKQLWKKKFKKK